MHLPVELVYGPTGAIELDPDARVQQAIRLVLQKFDELGSIRQVLLWLRRERLSVPVTRGGKHGRYTEWASANYIRVHAIVTSPFLAGAYVYGKSESRTTIVDGRIRRTSGHDLAVDQWQVVIPDHHPGYLDWATYRRHLSMIEANIYMKPGGAQVGTRGPESLGWSSGLSSLRLHAPDQLRRTRQRLAVLPLRLAIASRSSRSRSVQRGS
jgi:Recombinase